MKLERDEVITPGRVQALLRQRHPDVVVDDVAVVGESEGSASRLRLEVGYADGSADGLPTRLFLKRNLAEFTFPPEMYLTEVRFYRDVLPRLPGFETPRVFAMEVDETTGAFVLLMEDLGARARLGIGLEPCTPDEIANVLDDVAVLHAAHWDDPEIPAHFPWLDKPDESLFIKFWREAGTKLARKNLGGHRGPVVEGSPWVHDRLWPAFGTVVDRVSEGPLTVLHGDLHVGNTYFTADAGGVLDWQLMLHGNWVVDACYILTSAFDADQRADVERDLLDGYLDSLRRRGVEPPSSEDAWNLYRAASVWGVVMWVVTPDGVHLDEAQRIYLRRCVDAAEDLGALELLGA